MRNLGKTAPNSSQRPSLVEANSSAIPCNREKRRDSKQDLQNIWCQDFTRSFYPVKANKQTSASLKPSLADCVAAGAAAEAARLTAGAMVWAMEREMELISLGK